MNFVPKETLGDEWHRLESGRAYAVRCRKEDEVYLRFGQGLGLYLAILNAPNGRVINSLDYETGDRVVLGKLTESAPTVLGRTSQSGLVLMHAMVSRQHVEFLFEKGILLVKDLGSTNGTYCFKTPVFFDVDRYLEAHPVETLQDQTADRVHEEFGFEIDDFLRHYSQKKETSNDGH